MFEYKAQLTDLVTNRAIYDTVTYQVVSAGTARKVSLYDANGAAMSNPATATSGFFDFKTAESVSSVDIYALTSTGYAFQVFGMTASDRSELFINRSARNQSLIIPFSIADSGVTAAAEQLTGFKLPKFFQVNPQGLGVYVSALDAAITMDVGTNSSTGTDDPNGFLAAISLAALGPVFGQVGYVVGTNSVYVDLTGGTGEWTYGELMGPANAKGAKAEGTDSTTTKNGLALITQHIATGGTTSLTEEVTYTLSSGADTAEGFIILPSTVPFPV